MALLNSPLRYTTHALPQVVAARARRTYANGEGRVRGAAGGYEGP